MNARAQISLLPDGHRLHMHDGPIDLIVEAFGRTGEIKDAYQAASRRFVDVLDELCAELPLLRAQARKGGRWPGGESPDAWPRPLRPTRSEHLLLPWLR